MQKTNKKNKIALIGMIVLILCAVKANAAGVLIIDAGVLPVSRLYFLDKFDEWVQKNIFTFGISSFRAEAALSASAERVAELQFLNAQGMLSEKLSKMLLVNWEENISFAARLTGDEFASGRRPVLLADEIIKTALASTDAIQMEFNENLTVGEQTIFLADNLLSRVEARVINSVFSETAVVLEQVFRLVVEEIKTDTENTLKKIRAQITTEEKDKIIRVGSTQLLNLAEKDNEEAKVFYENNNFRNALDALTEARQALRLAVSNELVIEPVVFVDEEELKNRLDEMEVILFESGLIDATDIVAERTKAMVVYRTEDSF